MTDFVSNICRIVGHELGNVSMSQEPFVLISILEGTCSRCQSTKSVRIKYVDMYTRGFSVIEKAKDKLKEKFKQEGQAEGKDL